MRATIETHESSCNLPPIQVMVSLGDEDMSIKVGLEAVSLSQQRGIRDSHQPGGVRVKAHSVMCVGQQVGPVSRLKILKLVLNPSQTPAISGRFCVRSYDLFVHTNI